MVVGNCGVGKSTFSKQLHAVTNIKLVHLDQYYWKPNWVEPDKLDWKSTVQKIVAKPNWIIDGNYGGTMGLRIERADTIIFLNYSTRIALWRVFKRIIKYRNEVRPDMPNGCRERFNLNFLYYVASFNFTRRKELMKKLSSNSSKKQVYIFANDVQASDFLNALENKK